MLVMEAVRYRKQLVDRARPMVGDYAEDVVSDLTEYFLRGRFRSPEKPLPLLMWYVKRRCIDHIRQSGYTVQMTDNIAFNEDQDITDDKIEKVERALRELHPMVARLVVMHYAEGMTAPAIAKSTGIKLRRIQYLLQTGREQIQNHDKETRPQ